MKVQIDIQVSSLSVEDKIQAFEIKVQWLGDIDCFHLLNELSCVPLIDLSKSNN